MRNSAYDDDDDDDDEEEEEADAVEARGPLRIDQRKAGRLVKSREVIPRKHAAEPESKTHLESPILDEGGESGRIAGCERVAV